MSMIAFIIFGHVFHVASQACQVVQGEVFWVEIEARRCHQLV
jgi:hypothetical protein